MQVALRRVAHKEDPPPRQSLGNDALWRKARAVTCSSAGFHGSGNFPLSRSEQQVALAFRRGVVAGPLCEL